MTPSATPLEDDELETFLRIGHLSADDASRLAQLGPVVIPHLPKLTDHFYTQLQTDPQIAPHLEGRIDMLKATHVMWLQDLFCGDYGADFIARQEKIGFVHVKVKVPTLFVSSSMSFLRAEIPLLLEECTDQLPEPLSECTGSVLRVLDLCHYLIDRAYFKQMMSVMGISRALLDRLMTV